MASFAIIPAAGKSRRMGQDKLSLPWANQSLIQATLHAWQSSQVDNVIVIVSPENRPLISLVEKMEVDLVVPASPPPEMKDSVEAGLHHIEANYEVTASDCWLLAPADMPSLSENVIDQLISEFDKNRDNILVPMYEQVTGHPVLFPWQYAEKVYQLPPDQGINSITKESPVKNIAIPGIKKPQDIDTIEDYAKEKPC